MYVYSINIKFMLYHLRPNKFYITLIIQLNCCGAPGASSELFFAEDFEITELGTRQA